MESIHVTLTAHAVPGEQVRLLLPFCLHREILRIVRPEEQPRDVITVGPFPRWPEFPQAGGWHDTHCGYGPLNGDTTYISGSVSKPCVSRSFALVQDKAGGRTFYFRLAANQHMDMRMLCQYRMSSSKSRRGDAAPMDTSDHASWVYGAGRNV